jgi:hypothetical protein
MVLQLVPPVCIYKFHITQTQVSVPLFICYVLVYLVIRIGDCRADQDE